MAILEGIAIKGLTAVTTTLIKKFTDLGWSKVVEEFNATFNEEDLIRFCKACDEYVNIRTLYSSQHDIFIDDVYVPLFMSPSNDREKQYEISNLSFYSEGITNIIGKAGQGKSTFLRKMLINELKTGNAIPVFFELKYLNTEEDLLSQLARWFEKHNLNISPKGISRLLRYGYVKVFFDGFDEIHPSKHSEALSLIKDLSRAYPKVTIIVTSRPDTLITTEPFISNYSVLDLTNENVRQLFLNISEKNEEKTNEAMEQLEKHKSIRDIAKTPILAILLFITYRAWSKIPDNLADFYKKIFITLLTHHDSIKPGKKIDRGINIPLNDHQIEDVFSAFCFATFGDDCTNFSTREASKFMEVALASECYEDICSSNLVDIIKQCTGILCSDGYDQIAFSHKSLQEYYTASFISRQRIHDIRSFYSSVKILEEEQKFEAVLKFLNSIDRLNYTKYYYLPCFKEMFDCESIKSTIDERVMMVGINKVIASIEIPFSNFEKGFDRGSKTLSIGLKFEIDDGESSFFYMRLMQPILYSLIKSGVYFDYLGKHKKVVKDEVQESPVFDVALCKVLEDVSKDKNKKFMDLLISEFADRIGVEYSFLVDFYKRKSKPGLLNKVFKKDRALVNDGQA